MTNPATPPATPASGGGMPKWLIIVLVLLLLIILGCCGGFAACRWACKAAGSASQGMLNAATQRAHDELMAATQRAAEEAKRQAAQNAGGAEAPAGGGGGGTPTPVVGGKLPANFPKDVPVMAGLSSTGIAMSDNTKGSGMAQFTGSVKVNGVIAYYEKQMKDGGWTESANNSFGGMSSLAFTKDKRTVTIQAIPDNANTVVSIVYETTP